MLNRILNSSLIYLSLLATVARAVEINGKTSLESFYRFTDSTLISRLLVEATAKQPLWASDKIQLDLQAEGRAWLTDARGTAERDWSEIAPRNFYVTFTEEDLRLRVGYQILNWGETFGTPPTDLMNPRDYRNFDFLDSPKNKIAIPLLSASYSLGDGNLQAFFSPKGNAPHLPKALNGIAINSSSVKDRWLESFEAGGRFSYVLSSMNFDLSYLNHFNRFPALDLNPILTGVELVPVLKNVSTFGLGVSRGFEQVVLRADARYTVENPVGISVAQPIRTFRDSYAVVVGADWSPTFVEMLTLGIQLQLDRYPIPGTTEQPAVNFLARKSLFRDRMDLEAQFFQGLKLKDRFLQLVVAIRPYGSWTGRFLFQGFRSDPASPLSFLGNYDRLGGEIAFAF